MHQHFVYTPIITQSKQNFYHLLRNLNIFRLNYFIFLRYTETIEGIPQKCTEMRFTMKKIIRYGFFILFSILFCNGIRTGPEAHAAPKYKDMHCEKEVTTKTDVKIKWRKQKNTSGYLVYRSLQLKEDTWSKAKKIATLPSDKTSLSDKTEYKKTYKYEIISYTKKGKKIKKEFTDYFFVYMGVGQADWTEYFSCEAVTTPDSIELQYAGNYYGMMPDTYEIYRSKTKKNFKKIASVKAKKQYWGGEYTDKGVSHRASYYYKVRASKTMDGKKIYGKYSRPILLSAVNSKGKVQTEILTPQAEAVTSLDVLLTSKEGNADIILDSKHIWDASCWSKKEGSVQLRCSYSLDGKEWKTFSEEAVTIKPEEKIYLHFESESGKSFPHPANLKEDYKLYLYDLSYNNLTCYLLIDFSINIGTVLVNLEYYH